MFSWIYQVTVFQHTGEQWCDSNMESGFGELDNIYMCVCVFFQCKNQYLLNSSKFGILRYVDSSH